MRRSMGGKDKLVANSKTLRIRREKLAQEIEFGRGAVVLMVIAVRLGQLQPGAYPIHRKRRGVQGMLVSLFRQRTRLRLVEVFQEITQTLIGDRADAGNREGALQNVGLRLDFTPDQAALDLLQKKPIVIPGVRDACT